MKSSYRDKLLIAIGIVAITLLHYFTYVSKWGLHDFYRRLYYIPIIYAAFRFKLKGGAISSLMVVVVYAPHLLIYFGTIDINVINQFLENAMFIVVGTITGTLVQSESKYRRLLEIQVTKLTDLENYTQNILDSIQNGVASVDRNLRIVSINTGGKNILNLAMDGIGEDIAIYFEDTEGVRNMLLESLKNNRHIHGFETNCIKEKQTKIPVKLHSYPLKNILNKAEGAVLIIEDVSQVKKLENQVRRAEKLSAVGELASGIAHEIRNPLGIIKTISQTISQDADDEEIREGLKIIRSEIDRSNRVIQGLLDFAKPSVLSGRVQSINNVINDMLLLTSKYARQHGVRIYYTCVEDSIANVDADKLKQAFINIIFNSVQAMPSGGSIHIDLNSSDEWAVISVKDSGIGIEKERLEKVFEPFYTTKEKGTGLGLSITHRIIEEHKGYIEIESEVGKGTTVRIYLPKN